MWNYQFNISPFGLVLEGIRNFENKQQLTLRYMFNVDSYIVDSDILSDMESLMIKKHSLSFNYKYFLLSKLKITASLGEEFEKKLFQGKNLTFDNA